MFVVEVWAAVSSVLAARGDNLDFYIYCGVNKGAISFILDPGEYCDCVYLDRREGA